MERISEKLAIESLPLDITSATTFYAPAVSLKGAQSVAFVVSMGAAVAGQGIAIAAQQGADVATVESSNAAAIAGATAFLGSTIANYVYKASRIRITITTAATDNQTIVLNGTTMTNATAVAATSYVFGTTAGATAASGADPIVTSLTSMINKYFPKLAAATVSTAALDVYVKDGESTSITALTTGGGITPSYLRAQTILEVQGDGLNSTSEYVGCVVSSASTAIAGSIITLKKPNILPARAHGVIVNDTNT
jgi:hypothetical protein